MTRKQRLGSRRRTVQVVLLRLALVVLFFGAWGYGTGPGGMSRLILPPLGEVVGEFGDLLGSEFLLSATMITVGEILAAFVIATAIGLLVGFFLSRTSVRAEAAEPVLAWMYMFPFVLLYPLFLLWMGVGVSSKIAYAAIAAAIPIAYNTLRGLRSVDAKYTNVGRAFGASSTQADVHIKFGAARPMILTGIRVGISIVLISVVLAELLGSTGGLGFELQRASNTFQSARAFALVFMLIVVTLALQWLLERLMLRGRHPDLSA